MNVEGVVTSSWARPLIHGMALMTSHTPPMIVVSLLLQHAQKAPLGKCGQTIVDEVSGLRDDKRKQCLKMMQWDCGLTQSALSPAFPHGSR